MQDLSKITDSNANYVRYPPWREVLLEASVEQARSDPAGVYAEYERRRGEFLRLYGATASAVECDEQEGEVSPLRLRRERVYDDEGPDDLQPTVNINEAWDRLRSCNSTFR